MQHYPLLPAALFATTVLSGCATVQDNPSLNDARNDYGAVQHDSQVAALAPAELKQAGDALTKANIASSNKEDADVVTHLAYLAKQRVAIARETTKRKDAEVAITNAEMERDKIRLDARTDEANEARLSAALSQLHAEISRHEADELQRQAEISQQEAATAQQQLDISQQQAHEAGMRASELEVQLQDLNAEQTERGLVIVLGDMLFDADKTELKSSDTDGLQKLAAFLKEHPERQVQIEGHTDSTGPAEYNQQLSERRANAVRAFLIDAGVSGDRIVTRGYGHDSPVASNNTAAGRQMNRRVEIVLSDEPGSEVTSR